MAETLICAKCGTVNPADSRFCNECGGTLLRKDSLPLADEQKPVQPAHGGMSLAEQRAMRAFKRMETTANENAVEKEESKPAQTMNPPQTVRSAKELLVGWLVCISGEARGKDYRIYSGNNSIGNTENSQICLADNKAVNGDNYATIAYYKKQNAFYVMPGEGGGIIRINNEVIEVPTPLQGSASITIGEKEYKFIPLCTEEFLWEEE